MREGFKARKINLQLHRFLAFSLCLILWFTMTLIFSYIFDLGFRVNHTIHTMHRA